MRKLSFLVLYLFIQSASPLLAQPTERLIKILVAPNHSDWTYKNGESVKFDVTVLENSNVRIFDDGVQETKRAELADRLRAIFRTRAERVLFLTADSNLPFQSVADVIDISESVVDFVA